MKKWISKLLVAALILTQCTCISFAADWQSGTEVQYTANTTEQYTITVPGILNPGATGEVIAEGSWKSTSTLHVSADDTVTITCDIDNQTEVLDIFFDGIDAAGSNTDEMCIEEDISVQPFTALFGTWSGRFNYNASLNSTDIPVEVDPTAILYSSGALVFQRTPTVNSTYGTSVATYDGELNQDGTVTYSTDWKSDGNYDDITSVIIEDGINIVNTEQWFMNCTNLTNVYIGDGMTLIDEQMFEACFNLTTVTGMESVETVGYRAFAGGALDNGKLTTINLSNVKAIEGMAFYNNSLTSVDLSNVKSIESYAFAFNKLQSIDLSNTESIGLGAFLNNQLNSVLNLDKIELIEMDAFGQCPIETLEFGISSSDALMILPGALSISSDNITIIVPDVNNINTAITSYNWGANGPQVTFVEG